jgi:hypothetical protein
MIDVLLKNNEKGERHREEGGSSLKSLLNKVPFPPALFIFPSKASPSISFHNKMTDKTLRNLVTQAHTATNASSIRRIPRVYPITHPE